MAKGETLSERMTSVEGWQEGHEALCAERYKNIHGRINLIFWALALAASILVAVTGWSLNRVFENQQDQLTMLRSVRADVQAPAAAPRP